MRRSARPWAEALLGTAGSVEEAAAARDQLRSFATLMHQVPALGRMAANPAVPMEVKSRILRLIGERLELVPLSQRFLGMLVERYRLGRLDEVIDALGELLNARLGVATARVASAEPLADEQQRRLAAILERKLGKRVELTAAVDRDLLAGFVVRVGSERYDASLQGQLRRLKEQLAAG